MEWVLRILLAAFVGLCKGSVTCRFYSRLSSFRRLRVGGSRSLTVKTLSVGTNVGRHKCRWAQMSIGTNCVRGGVRVGGGGEGGGGGGEGVSSKRYVSCF